MNFSSEKIGKFTLHVAPEVFDDTSDYRECYVTEEYDGIAFTQAYIHLHKDERIAILDLRSFSGIESLTNAQHEQRKNKYCLENSCTEEQYDIRLKEFRAYESRTGCVQPNWKLHISTVNRLRKKLHELI